MSTCLVCESDRTFLASLERPQYESGGPPLTVVDLFAGCGALTLGLAEVARLEGKALDIRLAVEMDPDAAAVYLDNFPAARVDVNDVGAMFDGELGAALTSGEVGLAADLGRVAILAGGPPCQGHSDLNNHTRRSDDRNRLYLRMARAAEVLRPDVVFIENVPGVLNAKEDVVGTVRKTLRRLGYQVEDATVALVTLGVPQRRRRHVLIGYRAAVKSNVLAQLTSRCNEHIPRDVRWAIGDLVGTHEDPLLDEASTPSEDNLRRMQWLIDNGSLDLPNTLRPVCHQGDHTYRSMYGRLRWDAPAQTITTGFGSMGQGRYVHPAEPRTLTPHEAARLQMVPDFFRWGAAPKRSILARLIGNAVPPILATEVVRAARKVAPPTTARVPEAPEQAEQLALEPAWM